MAKGYRETLVTLQLVICLLCVVAVLGGCQNKHSYRFLTENDSYHPVESPDANYTSGLAFLAVPAKKYWKGDNKTVDKLNFLQWGENVYPRIPMTLEYGLGQVFYTPDDISIDSLEEIDRNGRPLKLDRPYAGFLFLQGAIHNHYGDEYDRTSDKRRSVSAKIGLTGSGSMAEEVHTSVHESRDLIIPQGWGLQVGQEVGFTFGLEQRDRVLAFVGDRWGADVTTNLKASLGNIYTGIDAGATLRVGLNLPRGYHQSSIIEEGLRPTRPDPGWYIYGFISSQNRIVLRDLTLQGRLFNSDPHTISKEPVVNEIQYGLQFKFKEHWGLQALFAHRSDQIKDQRKEHSFGQYVLMYEHSIE